MSVLCLHYNVSDEYKSTDGNKTSVILKKDFYKLEINLLFPFESTYLCIAY